MWAVKRTFLQVTLAFVALAVAAWFALGWVQDRDTARAQVIASSGRLTPSQIQSAQSLLDSAATLNPDRTVDETRAQLASDQHEYRRAISILESITHAEPLNLSAWVALSVAAGRARRVGQAEAAFRHIHVLLAQPK